MKACVTQNTEGTLTSALLELRALHHASLPPSRGHLIHAMFHQLLTRIDPALSTQLHQAGIHRPFTFSPLLENQREEQTMMELTRFWRELKRKI